MATLSLPFAFLCFIITLNVGGSDLTHFSDDGVSINCGSSETSSPQGGTKWLRDAPPILHLKGSSITSSATTKSAHPLPYKTARLSRTRFSYVFHLDPGHKIIRFHFNPSSYTRFKGLLDLFTIQAGPFTLLGNFSASRTANALGVNYLTKDFCLNIQDKQLLEITLSSETTDTYVFINGVEIIPVPASLSYTQGGDIGLPVVGRSLVSVGGSIALEIIQRFTRKDLIIGMSAPWEEVGKSDNVGWKISVEVGFSYLVRLHFSNMSESGGAFDFNVFINEQIVDTEKDGSSNPWYVDCIVMMKGYKREGKRDILISLQSDHEIMDTPLKGIEILKLSNHFNSLASSIPMPPFHESTSPTLQTLQKLLGSRSNAIGTVVVIMLSIVCVIVRMLRDFLEVSSREEVNRPLLRTERVCRRFSLSEMQLATRNFSDELVIGRGGFGKVYKGLIGKGKTVVAIKRLKSNSMQGTNEFLMETDALSQLRHINIVSLVGYCSEGMEMILVYEYMACGTLGDHLYGFARRGIDASPLTWKQRLSICIGAARGLDYIHTGQRLIHRDVKASNILLDENLVAKVSDFGLAKSEDRSKLQSHISTKVKGTFGYWDPAYVTTQKLTSKSDVYSFGVVLLEALCGRPAVVSSCTEDERVIAVWAKDKISKGEADEIVDSSLKDEISADSLNVFSCVAIKCLVEEPNNRPTMSQVLLQLELALQHQDIRVSPALSLNDVDEVTPDGTPSNNDSEILREASADVQAAFSPEKKERRNKKTNWGALWRVNPFKRRELSPTSDTHVQWRQIQPFKIEFGESDPDPDPPHDLLMCFSLDDIKTATHNFSSDLVLSHNVYKGFIHDGATPVAIKRMVHDSRGDRVYSYNRIVRLSKLRCPNLISLIGYCSEEKDKIVVYDYVGGGSLYDRFRLDSSAHYSPLTWKQRLRICLGVAKGLHYIHMHNIVHGNVRPTTILLDNECNAKIQISACEYEDDGETRVFNRMPRLHSDIYMDPSYLTPYYFTTSSDVYSFGVTLIFVVCGAEKSIYDLKNVHRLDIDPMKLEEMIDSNIKGQISAKCFTEFAETACACVHYSASGRPSMGKVVESLESAIKFQE